MSDYWDYTDRFGYDLPACLNYNEQPGFGLADVVEILAVFEGENDSFEWRWILKLSKGRFALLKGGCDYSGWDCQSGADSEITRTAAQAVKLIRSEKFQGWDDKAGSAYLAIQEQLRAGRKKTKREIVGEALESDE